MTDTTFQIGAEGIDSERLVAEIRASVAAKRQAGRYADVRIARAERHNLRHLQNEEEFLEFYLDCLRDAVFVDISDFEITERRARFSRALIQLKRIIWNLLKFYTYRLWSQQNLVNGLLLSAVETADQRHRDRIRALETRLARLEQELADVRAQAR